MALSSIVLRRVKPECSQTFQSYIEAHTLELAVNWTSARLNLRQGGLSTSGGRRAGIVIHSYATLSLAHGSTRDEHSQVCGAGCWLKTVCRPSHDGDRSMSNSPTLVHENTVEEGNAMLEKARTLYKVLTPQQIRLLKIMPATSSEPIRCELLQASITELEGAQIDDSNRNKHQVDFDALSYSWGKASYTCSILCNDIKFPVTEHLKTALLHLRLKRRVRFIWTDAFCINQANLVEKGEQVQLMFTIFAKARKVVGWLGDSTEQDRHLLTYLTSDLKSHTKILKEHKRAYEDQNGLDFLGRDFGRLLHVGPLDNRLPQNQGLIHEASCQKLGKSLQDTANAFVSNRPWFRRTWVRQEAVAARKLELQCGRFIFKLQHLAMLISERQALGIRPFWVLLASLETGDTLSGRSDQHEQLAIAQRWLGLALQNAQGFEASIDQDRIFALQNIAQPGVPVHERYFAIIDYRKTTAEVYESFVKTLINRSGTLDVLAVFEPRGNRCESPGLASWVPDFGTNKPRLVQFTQPARKADALNRTPRRQQPTQILRDRGILRLRGFPMGHTVESVDVTDEVLMNIMPVEHNIPMKSDSSMTHNELYGSDSYTKYAPNVEFKYHDVKARNHFIHEALRTVHYNCRSWHPVFDQSTEHSIDSTVRISASQNNATEYIVETRILATQYAQMGDLVVCFPPRDFRTFAKGDHQQHLYLIRPSRGNPSGYTFLGPCIMLARCQSRLASQYAHEAEELVISAPSESVTGQFVKESVWSSVQMSRCKAWAQKLENHKTWNKYLLM